MATLAEPVISARQLRWCVRSRAAWRPLFLALLLVLGAGSARAQTQAPEESPPVRIAAASDLRFALDDIAATFEEESGYRLRITYGSTGNFAYQIREGAPFHLFLAADERYIDGLARDSLTQDAGARYAVGRVALVVPKGTFASAAPTLAEAQSRLAASPGLRFAIANPSHAPYGERARDVLQHQGLWDSLQSQLVLGENVSQAAQFALSGNTVGGLIAWSLALAPQIAARADSALIPAGWHSPLNQRMVLLRDAPPGAFALYDYLRGAPARAVLQRYGFALPSGDT
ncbi:MAG: molybdate ABC transporter substrate-binding protein [Chromatocurvus sp.]